MKIIRLALLVSMLVIACGTPNKKENLFQTISTISLLNTDHSSDSMSQKSLRYLRRDLVPLYIQGDLNADRVIDKNDLDLIKEIITDTTLIDSGKIQCLAAADINLDLEVNQKDLIFLDSIVNDSIKVVAAPLNAQPYFRCDYSNFFVASVEEFVEGEIIPFIFEVSIDKSEVEIKSINTEFELFEMTEENGYGIKPKVKPGDLVYFDISIKNIGDFTYTLSCEKRPDLDSLNQKELAEIDKDRNGENENSSEDIKDPTRNIEISRSPTEEITEKTLSSDCPQRGNGCEALVLDLSRHIWDEFDIKDIKDELEEISCNVRYVAPKFMKVPKVSLYKVLTFNGIETRIKKPDPNTIQKVKTYNKASTSKIKDALEGYYKDVAKGREVVILAVNAHGKARRGPFKKTQGNCGAFNDETKAYSISRSMLYTNAYKATKHKTCSWMVIDFSCYAGATPKAIQELSNRGKCNCTGTSHNKTNHVGYDFDVAYGSATDSTVTTNLAVKNKSDIIENLIQKEENRQKALGGESKRTNYQKFILDMSANLYAYGESGYLDFGYKICNKTAEKKKGFTNTIIKPEDDGR